MSNQVTTQSKAQTTQWEIQDEVQQAAKEWIDKANKTNADRMHTEMKGNTIGTPSPTQPQVLIEEVPVWQALTCSQLSIQLHKVLQLLPRFKDTLTSLTTSTKPNLTSRQPCRARDWVTPHGLREPRGENHHQRTRHSRMHHRRSFRCQRDQ